MQLCHKQSSVYQSNQLDVKSMFHYDDESVAP